MTFDEKWGGLLLGAIFGQFVIWSHWLPNTLAGNGPISETENSVFSGLAQSATTGPVFIQEPPNQV
jgi:hypothetical protein